MTPVFWFGRAASLAVLACFGACSSDPIHAQAVWSRSIVGSVTNAYIDRGTVVFGSDRRPASAITTQAFDVETGQQLWDRNGALPLRGAASFLTEENRVERVAARTGRVLWKSAALCTNPDGPPTFGTAIGATLYAGCGGGKIFALRESDGGMYASASPVVLDDYDQIVALGDGDLAVSGIASGAMMYRQSAILKRNSLSTVTVLDRDQSIVGEYRGDIVIADTCCQGGHTDASPAGIELLSPATMKADASAGLHPYGNGTPPGADRPGGGLAVVAGDTLYIGTHRALFAYRLAHLHAQPRVVYAHLLDLPTQLTKRYLSIAEPLSDNRIKVSVLDTYNGLRVISATTLPADDPQDARAVTRQQLLLSESGPVRTATVDGSCRLGASDERHAFMWCANTELASHLRLGSQAMPLTAGTSTLLPQSIAVYSASTIEGNQHR